MDLEAYPPIVIDNGSSMCRSGLAGNDAPTSVFPNVIGRRRHEIGLSSKNYIGDEAQDKRELLTLAYPVERGIIVNWEDMEKIWNYMFFSELKLSPEQHPVLFGEPPFNPKGQREKHAQVMFETYQVPAFYLGFEATLSLMSMGRNCGTILNIGEGYTSVASFWESYCPLHAVSRYDFGGRDLTCYLQQILQGRGYSFTTTAELEIVREIKEQLCSVVLHKDSAAPGNTGPMTQAKFKLPDGTHISVGPELHACAEALFVPDGVFNSSGLGVTKMVHNSIMACDISCRRDMYGSVLLCGGSTFFPGFAERLRTEVIESGPWDRSTPSRVRVIDSPERKYHVWIGGSILASLTSFSRAWITREEYHEYGPQIMHRKST